MDNAIWMPQQLIIFYYNNINILQKELEQTTYVLHKNT